MMQVKVRPASLTGMAGRSLLGYSGALHKMPFGKSGITQRVQMVGCRAAVQNCTGIMGVSSSVWVH